MKNISLSIKGRPRCYAKSPTVQDTYAAQHFLEYCNKQVYLATYIQAFATAACLLAFFHLAIKMTSIAHTIITITSADGMTVLMVIMMGTGRLVCASSDGCCNGRKEKQVVTMYYSMLHSYPSWPC